MSLFNEASLVVTPNGYKADKLYSIKPTSGAGDLDVVRATGATRVNESGLIESVAANVPRLDYSNGSCPSILIEPQRTNLYLNSDVLVTQNVTTTATNYTVSFYGTGTITFSGTYVGSLVGTAVNNRVTLTFTATAGTLTSTVTGSVTQAQIEADSNATSYIPTEASTVTRNADVMSKTEISDLIGQTEGTIYAEVNLRNSPILAFLIQLSDGTNNNRVQIAIQNSLFWQVTGNNLLGINNAGFDFVDDSLIKIAFGYKNGDSIVYINGVEATSLGKTSANVPLALNRIDFAKNHTSNFPVNCNINKALLFKTRLSDAELIQLTTL